MRLASHGSMPLKRGSLISSSRMGATSEGAGCTLAARLKPGFGPRRLGSATSAVGATGAAAAGVETGGASAAGAAVFAAEAGAGRAVADEAGGAAPGAAVIAGGGASIGDGGPVRSERGGGGKEGG